VHKKLAPTSEGKRITALDILRGFAVIGIFVVNIQVMSCHFSHRGVCNAQWTSALDNTISMLIKLFFVHKFLAIFSFLFGVGIAMQLYKQIRKNNPDPWFFIRRMAGLYLLGMLHILLFWSGDVLHIYALLGLLLIWLMRKSNVLLIGAGIAFFVFPFYHQVFGFLNNLLQFSFIPNITDYTHQELMAINLKGTYLDTVKLRISEYIYNIRGVYTGLVPRAFLMFTFGAWLVKKQVLSNMDQFVVDVRSKMITAFLLSFTYLLLVYFVILPNMYLLNGPSLAVVKKIVARVNHLLYSFSNIVIALFYIWLLVYSLRWPISQKVLGPLRYIGHMALTNYVMHSVIALFLFSSVGLGTYGNMRPSTGIIIVVVTSIFQILFSKIWLDHYKFGPLEWVWRCFTYKKYLMIRKNAGEQSGFSLSPDYYKN